MTTTPKIVMQGVTKSFGDNQDIRGIDLRGGTRRVSPSLARQDVANQ